VADFIDDGPEGNDEDYSKHIREIFGYDPSRYKGIDEDDRGMESSFQQQQKEEFTSTKLGVFLSQPDSIFLTALLQVSSLTT
jgi:protein SPT2